MKLTSNIVIQNTEINIKISETETITVYLNKDTGYLSIIRNYDHNRKVTQSFYDLEINGEFNQPIILPDSLLCT